MSDAKTPDAGIGLKFYIYCITVIVLQTILNGGVTCDIKLKTGGIKNSAECERPKSAAYTAGPLTA